MVKSLSSEEALKLIKANKVLVLDVRTPQENAQSRIRNSILIPLSELEKRLEEIPKGKPILVYCRAGHRSVRAAAILEKNGFKKVLNLKEGILDWPEEGLE
jgi:phage shock protein E